MSAPIDDLLYGGDDSGDEEVPMPSVSGVPLTVGALAPSLATPPASLLSPTVSAPATVAASAPKTSAPTPIRQTPLVPTPTAQQAPGSGQQMFQQMFALLKQMLPVEQYATLHSEMRKGNGNDIKSIVDIIKRIAGDAIFSSVIQKMDLSRTFPAGNASGAFGSSIKPEPAVPATSSPGANSQSLAAHSAGMSTTTSSPKTTVAAAAASTIRPIASAPPALVASKAVAAATASSIKAATGQEQQRPSPIKTPAQKMSPPGDSLANTEATTPMSTTTTPSLASSASSLPASTTPATSSGLTPTQSSRNEALEKIIFAKRLLAHAATCTLSHGICQVKKCDDVRRVFKHSVSCGGANNCSHCEQLKGLVKYHIKECPIGAADHCTIPFCDPLRREHLATVARNAAAQASVARARGMGGTSKLSAADSDDDDNTPLSSAVSKAKKHSKAKSPKNAAVVRSAMTSHAGVPKRKGSNASNKPNYSSSSTTPTSATSVASTAAATGATSSPSAAAAAAHKGGKAGVPNMTQEYGRLLQLILHVEKCKTSNCAVGEDCAESKALLQQIYSPNAPARAKTYKQVYGHYKTCVAKKNTQNCPMCRIGLLPILPTSTGASLSASPQAPLGTKGTGAPASSTAASGSGTSASPLLGAAKRGSSAVSPTPRSPSKKARSNSTSRSKTTTLDSSAHSATTDSMSHELSQASVGDIRKEADVLTHTGIDLGAERRTMMESGIRRPRMAELLACKKEEWVEKDLFNSEALRTQMRTVARRSGVELGAQTCEVMSYALHEYLKQVMEEMVEVSKQRGDSYAQTLEELQKQRQHEKAMATGAERPGSHMELTATDILRVSCEDSFTKLRQEDLALRSELLEDAKREEQIEKERAKKRKKVDRSKQTQDERDEAEMDVEELAVKDLKERLLQHDKEGVLKVDGRVNESISTKYTPHVDDNQVTMEDANHWLLSQKPYIHPKLFVRAEAARIVTKALL